MLILCLVQFITVFLLVRYIISEEIREDKGFYVESPELVAAVFMLALSLAPVIGLILAIALGIYVVCKKFTATELIKKIFFIRK